MKEWYYVKNGEQQGPASFEQLRDMATNGTLLPEDLVWNSDMSDWVPASAVSGIYSPAGSADDTAITTPTTAPGDHTYSTAPLEEITPGSEPLDIGGTFSRTLELTKKCFAILAIQGLIYFGISIVLAIVPAIIQGLGGALGESGDKATTSAGIILLLISLLLQIVINIATFYLSLGIIRSCFLISEGREPAISTMFGEIRNLLHAVLAAILVTTIIAISLIPAIALAIFFMVNLRSTEILPLIIGIIGMLLLLIPGIYLSLRMAFVIPAVVDRNTNCIDAISYSFQITRGNSLRLLCLWFLATILIFLAIILTCGIGLIFATPIVSLGLVVAYRQLKYGSQALQ